jgi:hypothetical protein
MFVLSSSMVGDSSLCSSVVTFAIPPGFYAYLARAFLAPEVSTFKLIPVLLARSLTGEALVSILGEAIVLIALLVESVTELPSVTLLGEPAPSPPVPTNFS